MISFYNTHRIISIADGGSHAPKNARTATSDSVRAMYDIAKLPNNFMKLCVLAILFLLPAGPHASAQQGVHDTEIIFGQSAALFGPAARLGINMRAGLLAAFAEQNALGGVHGRTLKMVSYDDSYEPNKAIANTNRLLDQDKVFALIGSVGTPTSLAAAPIAQDRNVPFIGPFTGAGALRHKKFSVIANLRASYAQEAERIVSWLVDDQKLDRISVFYQDDSFGKAGMAGVVSALNDRKLQMASSGAYERNTIAVKRALLEIERGKPEAVIMVTAYAPAANFISWAHKTNLESKLICLSFVGTNALSAELILRPNNTDDVFVSQVVPNIGEANVEVVQAYRKTMTTHFPRLQQGFVSFEGYLVGRMTIEALLRSGRNLDRDIFMEEIFSGQFNLQGFRLDFEKNNRQGSNKVFLTSIAPDGSIVSAEKSR
jgi:branched-chain amino acid transport system substrate-binding protein